jgi:hypothetical protein
MADAADRIDPYELVFGAECIDDRLFPPIAEEADARRQPVDDPDRFLFLSSVGLLLQAIAGGAEATDDAAQSEEDPGSEGEEPLRQYGRLLFHAFHHWRNGKRRFTLETETIRRLLDHVSTVGAWRLRAPTPAGYLRLPRNLVWAAPGPGLRPEPADGLFWTLFHPDDAPAELHVLLALGVRPDRPGFSVVTASGVLDREPHWAEVEARPDGGDFESTLPGGDLDRLYSIENAAELLKLASLCFWELDPARG